jgi:exopolysaccharide biosynthesis polyprenyl glycosylphosphotransferase
MPKQSVKDERAQAIGGPRLTRERLKSPPRFAPPTAPTAAANLTEAPSRRAVEIREARYRRGLAYADAVAAFLALYAAVVVFGDDSLRWASLLVMPLVIVTSKLTGLYDRDELVLKKTTLEETGALFRMATLFALVTSLLDGLVINGYLGHRQILGLWGLLFIMALLGRVAAREIARRRTPPERCLIAGAQDTLTPVLAGFTNTHRLNADVVGHFRLEVSGRSREQTIRELQHAIVRNDVHRVILAPHQTDSDEFLDLISLVKGLGLRVSVVPRMLEVVGTAVEFDTLNGLTVLGIRRFGLSRSSRAVKRTMDLVGATIALVVLSPLLLVIVVAIVVDSRGGVVFRQTRVGRDGKRFTMLKFRTMIDGADGMKHRLTARNEATGLFKITDDPRITRVGRVLRRTSLDELPQLVNVVRGEMSLVGPRPLVVDEDCKIEGRHRRRLHLTPGMTGDWQILGSARIPLHEMVKIDYLYAANWSLWNDVKILARTVLYVVRARGM